MPAEAEAVHGLGDAFLADKPVFAAVAEEFVAFIGDAPLVIHNASFDMKFLNAELDRLGRRKIPADRAVDTLAMARKRYPGAPASLDALCRRYEIDNSNRTLHGALLDAELLAEVYLELRGGRQPGFSLGAGSGPGAAVSTPKARPVRAPRPHAPTAEELDAHAAFVSGALKDPIWDPIWPLVSED